MANFSSNGYLQKQYLNFKAVIELAPFITAKRVDIMVIGVCIKQNLFSGIESTRAIFLFHPPQLADGEKMFGLAALH